MSNFVFPATPFILILALLCVDANTVLPIVSLLLTPLSQLYPPISTNTSSIRFQLYTPSRGINNPQNLQLNNVDSVNSSNLNPALPLKIIVHGFWNNATSDFPQRVTTAYLKNQNCNVIVVDWGDLSTPSVPSDLTPLFYFYAAENVQSVGEYLGQFITWLIRKNFSRASLIHIVGHSLGAHVSGIAGSYVNDTLGKHVARITGLDPAGPLAYTDFEIRSLKSTDAVYVDAIHTDANFLGTVRPLGQVDFYLNKGFGPQPGCNVDFIQCSHGAAYVFFAISIDNSTIPQVTQCAVNLQRQSVLTKPTCQTVVFGEYSPAGTTGKYDVSYNGSLAS